MSQNGKIAFNFMPDFRTSENYLYGFNCSNYVVKTDFSKKKSSRTTCYSSVCLLQQHPNLF